MKLLFLDIDGVLNSADFFHRKTRDKVSICPTLTSRVDAICIATGAHVVISSTWRLLHSLQWLRRTLRRKGLRTPKILGVTPDFASGRRYRHERGLEIAHWIDTRAPNVEGIVILDDDSDMAHLAPWHVKTLFHRGITDDDAVRAMEVLQRPFDVRAMTACFDTNGGT